MTDRFEPGTVSNADCLPTYRKLLARIMTKGGQMQQYVRNHKESHIKDRLPHVYPAGIRLDRHIYAALWAAHKSDAPQTKSPVTHFDIGIYCSLKRDNPPPLRRFSVIGFVSPLPDGSDIIGANWAGGMYSKIAQKYMVHVTGTLTPVVHRPLHGPAVSCGLLQYKDRECKPRPLLRPSDDRDASMACKRLAMHVQDDLDSLSGHKGFLVWPSPGMSWRNSPIVTVYIGPKYVASAEVSDAASFVQAREYLKACALNHLNLRGAL